MTRAFSLAGRSGTDRPEHRCAGVRTAEDPSMVWATPAHHSWPGDGPAPGRPRHPPWSGPGSPPAKPSRGFGERLGNGRRHRHHRRKTIVVPVLVDGAFRRPPPTTRRASRFSGAGGAVDFAAFRPFLTRHRRRSLSVAPRWRGGFRWRGRASHSRQRTPFALGGATGGGRGGVLSVARRHRKRRGPGTGGRQLFAVLASRGWLSLACVRRRVREGRSSALRVGRARRRGGKAGEAGGMPQ
jgi:hypothetical protein